MDGIATTSAGHPLPNAEAVHSLAQLNHFARRGVTQRHRLTEAAHGCLGGAQQALTAGLIQGLAQQVGPSRGVPRFLLAIDGRITVSAYGTGGYSQVFLPALRAAVANRAAQPRAGLYN